MPKAAPATTCARRSRNTLCSPMGDADEPPGRYVADRAVRRAEFHRPDRAGAMAIQTPVAAPGPGLRRVHRAPGGGVGESIEPPDTGRGRRRAGRADRTRLGVGGRRYRGAVGAPV